MLPTCCCTSRQNMLLKLSRVQLPGWPPDDVHAVREYGRKRTHQVTTVAAAEFAALLSSDWYPPLKPQTLLTANQQESKPSQAFCRQILESLKPQISQQGTTLNSIIHKRLAALWKSVILSKVRANIKSRSYPRMCSDNPTLLRYAPSRNFFLCHMSCARRDILNWPEMMQRSKTASNFQLQNSSPQQ